MWSFWNQKVTVGQNYESVLWPKNGQDIYIYTGYIYILREVYKDILINSKCTQGKVMTN